MVRSRLDCVFDRHRQYEALATDIFNTVKSKDRFVTGSYGTISFADSARTPPLQLADLVCYLVSSRLEGRRKWTEDHDKALEDLLMTRPRQFRLIDKTTIDAFVRELPAALRSVLGSR